MNAKETMEQQESNAEWAKAVDSGQARNKRLDEALTAANKEVEELSRPIAEAKTKELDKEFLAKWCPVAKEMCREDCRWFRPSMTARSTVSPLMRWMQIRANGDLVDTESHKCIALAPKCAYGKEGER